MLIGLLRGLVKEVLSLLSWIIAFVVANTYGETLALWLPQMIEGTSLRLIVAFLALFIGVRILMGLLSMALDAVIKAAGLTLMDRGLGGVFGLARGLVIVMTVVLLCGMTEIPRQPLWKDAWFSPMAEDAAYAVMPYLPGEFVQHVSFDR